MRRNRSAIELAGAMALLFATLLPLPAFSHDLITADSAENYLASAQRYSATLMSTQPAAARAQAAYQLGRMLDEIKDFLNRDLAAHGAVQGLASNHLVAELKTRRLPLAQDTKGRFISNSRYYREALQLAPEGAHEAGALFMLAKGYFDDSVADDPLSPKAQSGQQLSQQIALCERLVARHPHFPELEEARFILLIHYVQAARLPLKGENYEQKARAALADFGARYPDSMRAGALPVLRDALPAN